MTQYAEGVRVWRDDEPKPSGVSSLDSDPTMLPNGREFLGFDPETMANLFSVCKYYRLNVTWNANTVMRWTLNVEDSGGKIHRFSVSVGNEVTARVRSLP